MARPKIIADKADLERHISEFICKCQDDNIRPTDKTFADFLGVSVDTLGRYDSEKDKYPGFADALKNLRAYREDRLVGLMEANPKAAAVYMFQLKQPKNGGYQDIQKVERSGNMGVQISLTGPDGKPIKNA